MKMQNPAPTPVGNGARNNAAGPANLVSSPKNFNRPQGPRLLREIMTPEWWASVLPEDVADDLRFARKVERLHKLGPAPLFYMLIECGRERGLMTFIEAKVAAYASLDPDVVKAMGGDEFVQHLTGLDGGRK